MVFEANCVNLKSYLLHSNSLLNNVYLVALSILDVKKMQIHY